MSTTTPAIMSINFPTMPMTRLPPDAVKTMLNDPEKKNARKLLKELLSKDQLELLLRSGASWLSTDINHDCLHPCRRKVPKDDGSGEDWAAIPCGRGKDGKGCNLRFSLIWFCPHYAHKGYCPKHEYYVRNSSKADIHDCSFEYHAMFLEGYTQPQEDTEVIVATRLADTADEQTCDLLSDAKAEFIQYKLERKNRGLEKETQVKVQQKQQDQHAKDKKGHDTLLANVEAEKLKQNLDVVKTNDAEKDSKRTNGVLNSEDLKTTSATSEDNLFAMFHRGKALDKRAAEEDPETEEVLRNQVQATKRNRDGTAGTANTARRVEHKNQQQQKKESAETKRVAATSSTTVSAALEEDATMAGALGVGAQPATAEAPANALEEAAQLHEATEQSLAAAAGSAEAETITISDDEDKPDEEKSRLTVAARVQPPKKVLDLNAIPVKILLTLVSTKRLVINDPALLLPDRRQALITAGLLSEPCPYKMTPEDLIAEIKEGRIDPGSLDADQLTEASSCLLFDKGYLSALFGATL